MKNAKQTFLDSILKEGEKYAGILLGEDGEPDRHIIKLPGDHAPATWEEKMNWAKSRGGVLPTCRMQSLLHANLKKEFQPTWYWSGEQREAGSAWFQGFDNGGQGWGYACFKCRAVAVRSVVI